MTEVRMKEHIGDLIIKCLRESNKKMTDADMNTGLRELLKAECLENCHYEAETRDDAQVCIYGVAIKVDDSLPDNVIVARDVDGHEILRIKT